MTLGFISLGLGIAGAFLPLLPTVPFLILAAFLFSKGSEAWHQWIRSHKKFGPVIDDWNTRGVIRRPAKVRSVFLIALSFALNVWVLWERPLLLAIVGMILGGSVLFILTRPSD